MGLALRTIGLWALALAALAVAVALLALGRGPTPANAGGLSLAGDLRVQKLRSTSCRAPRRPMTFAPQTFVDTERAGGEPTVATHPDGTLIYTAHAGTTQVFAPELADEDSDAFVRNYTGQTYIWRSEDRGRSWQFVERTLPPDGIPASGFSDPELAIDKAGNVYESEINLANVSVSRSSDSARSFTLQNPGAMTLTDRQWTAADRKDVLYITGNALGGGTFPTQPVGNMGQTLHRSTDGGQTFTAGVPNENGLGDLQVDQRNGTLYSARYDGEVLSMAAFRKAREGDLDAKVFPIAKGVDLLAHWPSFDLDRAGNLYITWDEGGEGKRKAGVYYSYSTNRGRSWARPVRVDRGPRTDIWPWLAVGDRGRVAIAWFGASRGLPDQNAETPGDHSWRVVAAQTLNGLGCDRSRAPGFRRAVATAEPIHTGTICQQGTTCQAQLIDRRLGDYFSIDIDGRGRLWAGYSDTRRGGIVSLPGFVRQKGGPSFVKR